MNIIFILEIIAEILIFLLFFLSLEYIFALMRLGMRKKAMDALSIKYGLTNNSKMPTWIQWILRKKVEVNIIDGKINNHLIKIIDTSRPILARSWLRSTFVQVDERIIKDHYKLFKWGGFAGGIRFNSIQTLEDIIKKETGIE